MVLGARKAPARDSTQSQAAQEVAAPPAPKPEDSQPVKGKPAAATPAPVAPTAQGLYYAKATFVGFPGTKEIVFIPDDIKWTQKAVDQMLSALGMKRPNLLLHMNESGCPRLKVLNEEEVQIPAVDSLLEPDAEVDDRSLTLRKILDNKIKDIAAAIIAALDQTKSCPVFASWGGPMAQMTEEINNTIGVSTKIISRFHLSSEYIPKDGKAMKCWFEIFDIAVPLSEVAVAAAQPLSVDYTWLSESLTREALEAWKGMDFASDDKGNSLPPSETHPAWTSWAGADLYFVSYRPTDGGGIDIYNGNGSMQLNMNIIAPTGQLLMGGRCKRAYTETVLSCFEGGIPLVLMRNAGGCAGIWAEIVCGIVDVINNAPGWQEKFAKSGASVGRAASAPTRLLAVSASKLLNHALVTAKPGNKPVELPDVQQALFVAHNRHELFLETVRVLDPLTHTPEQALEILSACFSSTYVGVQELGATSAQKDVIVLAWSMHKKMEAKAATLRRWDLTLAYLGAILAWVATVSASSLDVGRACDSDAGTGQYRFCSILGKTSAQKLLEFLTIVLPAGGALIVTMAARFQFRNKWGQVKMAAANIVQHIYLFRGGVDMYSIAKQGSDDEEISQNLAAKMARSKFVSNISAMQSKILSLDSMDLDANAKVSESDIPKHLLSSLYGLKIDSGTPAKGFAVAEAERLLEESDASPSSNGDDGVSAINAETYHKQRILRLLEAYEVMMPSLTFKTDALRLLIFLLGFIASMLGATHNSSWIPTVVGLTSMLEVLTVCHNMATRQGAMSSAIAVCNTMNLQWSGLTNMDRRTAKFKEFLMVQTEQLALSVVAAWVGQAASSSGKMDQDGKDATGGKDKEGSKKGGKSGDSKEG